MGTALGGKVAIAYKILDQGMPLLRHFLKLLELIEATQALFEQLAAPSGISAVLAIYLYFLLQVLGCEAVIAAILSYTSALTVFCLLDKPSA